MRKSKFSHKVIAVFLTLNFLMTIVPINQLFASNNGPTAPEAVGFEPVDATDMVNLTNGNLTYVLPLMSIEGFPINLSYHAAITPDLEASWVGLGWYLNPGAINRAINGAPDDWKEGVGISFTSFSETKTYYSITASASIPAVASVGIGAHWGGGQGLSGSIQAQLGMVSLYADTRGNLAGSVGLGAVNASFSNSSKPNYSVPVNTSFSGDSWSGNASYSGGTASATFKGAKGSLGISYSGGGDFSIGGANAKGVGVGISSSSSSESQGDATIDTKSIGISVTVPIGPISVSLGFKKQKVKVSILKGYINKKWGALYASDFNDYSSGDPRINQVTNSNQYTDGFTDYVNRDYELDSYSTRIPQSEEDFIGDYSKVIENINFTFMAYDNYNVSAQGMLGSLTPRVFQNANVIGKGGRTENTSNQDPIHMFWHHGKLSNNVQRSLDSTLNSFEFYFDGQFTRTESNDGNVFNATNLSTLDMNDLIIEDSHIGEAIGNNRAHQANYVEVFTNQEIANNQAYGLITPKDIPNSLRQDSAHFDPYGIGGYKITAADGKIYHFSLPVYHYERIQRSQLENQEYQTSSLNNEIYDCKNVNEVRQYTRYATHWLLTAVTGPDYVDRPDPNSSNVSGTFNKEDYGYWVELEYGKWSDGYVWRTPYQDFVYDYNTNLKSEIEDDDKGYYSFGRKQVYYLDRINSKNRTALFVKNIRYDGIGKELTFKFLNQNGEGNYIGHSGNGQNENSLNFTDPVVHVKENGVNYAREYSLRLDKIILIDSDNASLIDETGASNLGSQFPNYIPNNNNISPNWMSTDFISHYGENYNYDIHQEQNILDSEDLPTNFIENHALNVVQFNHSYQLVKDTPSSKIVNTTYGDNPTAARLTLNSIETLGKGGVSFMPPTFFDYYDSSTYTNPNFQPIVDDSQDSIQGKVVERRNVVDAWGYMQGSYNVDGQAHSKSELWSLKEIKTPTGASIEINYEEDDYWIEAFGRRYWRNEQLQFRFDETITGDRYVEFQVDPDNILSEPNFDFEDYFIVGDDIFIDITYDRRPPGSNDNRHIFVAGKYQVKLIQNGILRIDIPDNDFTDVERTDCNVTPWYSVKKWSQISNSWKNSFHQNYCNAGQINGDNTLKKFTIIANKVPENETGGGLRVKEIITSETNNIYKAKFDYTDPITGRSSGITSYAPVKGLKYIPYQSEVPPPGVMYEYVTMSETNDSDDFNAKTRYRHHVLKPVFNIFNPEIEIEALDSNVPEEDKLFWVDLTENAGNLDLNNPKKVEATKIDVNINTALFGQIKSIEILNSEDHILNKTVNEYANGRYLSSIDSIKGYTKETFNSLKTIFVSNDDGTTIEGDETLRLLSISSKTEYKNMLKKTISISGGQETFVEYSDLDPWLNSFRKNRKTMPDGTYREDVLIPAYEKYELMGSKVINPINNKNMLTQKAMQLTTINNGSNTLNANITTWNDDWIYRDYSGIETNESGIWRKHKSYVWKDKINQDGSYVTNLSENNDYFDWGLGVPTDNKWQNVSEITQYTHWSAPVETKDINGNFAASKMADNDSKVIAGGNAAFSEMFYSGGEFAPIGNYIDQQVFISNINQRDSLNKVAHTGKYSIKTNQGEFFGAQFKNGSFRSGKYKVSVWVHISNSYNPRIKDGANFVEFNGERMQAGNWIQLNHYIDLSSTSDYDIYMTSNSGTVFFDDFRVHPVSSSMNSYVYDELTDELTFILDANNMGTRYVYDKAGRLCKTYVEVPGGNAALLRSLSLNTTGGFKLVSTNKYHYQSMPDEDCEDCCNENLY